MTLATDDPKKAWKLRKFRNQPVEHDGERYDSKAEHRRHCILRLREKAKEIRNLERQPRFDIIVNGIKCGFYKADFAYFEDNARVIEDVKSEPTKTPVYRLKKKLVEALYGVTIVEVS